MTAFAQGWFIPRPPRPLAFAVRHDTGGAHDLYALPHPRR